MAHTALSTNNELVSELIETMGLKGEFVRDIHIHFPLDDLVTIDVTLLAKSRTALKLIEILKKYELVEISSEKGRAK